MTAITLPKDLEDWARAEVAAGRAKNMDELIARALETHRAAVGDVRSLLDEARAQVARGEFVTLEEFRGRIRQRVATLKEEADE